ncbi:hypothetical protein J9303_01055 [Bacillaceae bacterium Marseille-Q3522]|nr:hypothetical protein [Bacillaceae bacterium Marseille-Q3522]
MKGYKVFNPDWTCRGFQYEVGKTYEQDASPYVCNRGFHFCKNLVDCFNYYNLDPLNKVAEVIALGAIDEGEDKYCTNKIQIIREIPWAELLELVNIGKGNSGYGNSGDLNSGHRNSGDLNSGHRNSGHRNSGHRNSGNWNSGNWNSGDLNSGHRNSGHRNSGHRNSGNRNSGDWNSGDWNSGDFNIGSNNAGCFNTKTHKLLFFDRPANITMGEWRDSEAYYLLSRVDYRPTEWIYEEDMSDDEKAAYPDYKTTGGYLKKNDLTDVYSKWWDRLTEREKRKIREIPNFDAEKFFEITGIRA